jgi:hypothetical protein
MGVKWWEGGFRSYSAAQLAGKQALEDFLNGLSMEARAISFLMVDPLHPGNKCSQYWEK